MKTSKSVILLLVDGLRPDGLEIAETPQIDNLIENGFYTFKARTTTPSVTLSCVSSLLMGTKPEKHRVISNAWPSLSNKIPSIIDLVHLNGKTTGSFYNWEPLRDIWAPGSADIAFFGGNLNFPHGDIDVANAAVYYLPKIGLDFAFIYFGCTDIVGHEYGWMSPNYIQAIKNADDAIKLIVEATKKDGSFKDTIFIVTSDHGGHEYTHHEIQGPDLNEDLLIPWIVGGTCFKSGVELNTSIKITDTAPTIATILGIDPHVSWTGRVVKEIMNKNLMK
jgi:predicted AlkP superfamily pyrophosphatase or phosphodiesterase